MGWKQVMEEGEGGVELCALTDGSEEGRGVPWQQILLIV